MNVVFKTHISLKAFKDHSFGNVWHSWIYFVINTVNTVCKGSTTHGGKTLCRKTLYRRAIDARICLSFALKKRNKHFHGQNLLRT